MTIYDDPMECEECGSNSWQAGKHDGKFRLECEMCGSWEWSFVIPACIDGHKIINLSLGSEGGG